MASTPSSQVSSRNFSLDVIRSFAAFLVVINHVVETVYPFYDINTFNAIGLPSQLFAFFSFTLGRTGVPLFLLLSGYLLLTRDYDRCATAKFYSHNFFPMLFVWEVWILLYSIFLALLNNQPFDFLDYLQKALLLKHAGMPNSWYMPMILGMYLFLPYVANALQLITRRTLYILLSVLFIYCFLVPFVQTFTPFNSISSQIDLSFGGNSYGFYLVLGYCIKQEEKRREEKRREEKRREENFYSRFFLHIFFAHYCFA